MFCILSKAYELIFKINLLLLYVRSKSKIMKIAFHGKGISEKSKVIILIIAIHVLRTLRSF